MIIPIRLHKLPTTNSPNINPRKNGISFRYVLLASVLQEEPFDAGTDED